MDTRLPEATNPAAERGVTALYQAHALSPPGTKVMGATITNSADDRTFVVSGSVSWLGAFNPITHRATKLPGCTPTPWYLVRGFPGSAHPIQVAGLPIRVPANEAVASITLSGAWQRRALIAGPRQRPRAGVAGVAVGLIRDAPDRLGGAAEVVVFQRRRDQARGVRDGRVEGYRGWPLWRTFLAERALLRELSELEAAAESLHVPVLLIADLADRVVPVKTSRRLAGMLPNSRLLLVAGTGHHLPRRTPRAVEDAIAAFLAEIADAQPAAASDDWQITQAI